MKDKIAIAASIADAIAVERIYGLDYEQENTARVHLIIVATAPVGIRISELEPFVVMATGMDKRTTFKIYDGSEVRRLQKEGNIYHLSCCDVSNLLYEAKNATVMPSFTKADIRKRFTEAAKNFRNAMQRTGSFDNGAKFYMESNDPAVALFMLHQVCELSCRALEIGICGKDKRTHNISQHQEFLRSMVPGLKLLPDAKDGQFGRTLLDQLDKAYSAVRYESGFSADGIDIMAVYQLAKDLRNGIEATMEMFLKKENMLSAHDACVVKIPSQVEDKLEQTTGDEVMATILDIIANYLEPTAVYQLGMRNCSIKREGIFGSTASKSENSIHYDLLVISEIAYPYARNVPQHITSICGVGVSVLLLVHGQKEFSTAVQKGNSFFYSVAKSGKLLFGKEITWKTMATEPLGCGTEKLDCSMEFRTAAADELWSFSGELLDKGHLVLALSMMCQAAEQTCLGLISINLEYSPNLHSTGHLLKICTMFWPDADQYFPRSHQADRVMFGRLSDGQSLARYAKHENHRWEDSWEVKRRVRLFIDDAKAFANGTKHNGSE